MARETTVPAAISADERSSPSPPFVFFGAACLRRVDRSIRSGDVSSIMGTIYGPELTGLTGVRDRTKNPPPRWQRDRPRRIYGADHYGNVNSLSRY
ncbi:hypothetical protein GCM10010319_26640 [Streptomyces blastmyceticus]|uniref:Uncharacterized protein n=1 Tax=Streptomyces blastmyceticus TaxID=68180 RepID=A0ABP3GPP5_9ACTN